MKTRKAELFTDITLAIFRANGRLLHAGDELMAPLGLTSSRWQVLGAVALSDRPLSAPQIAEIMGITRQGSQKQIALLVGDGLLKSLPNPRNKRSPLYGLATDGQKLYESVDRVQGAWANQLSEDIPLDDLTVALRVLESLLAGISMPEPGSTPR